MNAIFGIIGLSLWLFEIILQSNELHIYDLFFETDVGRFKGMSWFLSFT